MNTLTVEEEAIQTILSRAEKGRKDYGEGLHEAEKPLEEWLDFAIEEFTDAALYLIRSKRKLREALMRLEEAEQTPTVPVPEPEPEIKMPLVGEVWNGLSGTATIRHCDPNGKTQYLWKSIYTGAPAVINTSTEEFVKHWQFGRS